MRTQLDQNIKFTMEEESNGELAFLDTLLKRNNGKISVLVYRKPTHTDQYLTLQLSIITNKDDLTRENARIKQVLKENGYQ